MRRTSGTNWPHSRIASPLAGGALFRRSLRRGGQRRRHQREPEQRGKSAIGRRVSCGCEFIIEPSVGLFVEYRNHGNNNGTKQGRDCFRADRRSSSAIIALIRLKIG